MASVPWKRRSPRNMMCWRSWLLRLCPSGCRDLHPAKPLIIVIAAAEQLHRLENDDQQQQTSGMGVERWKRERRRGRGGPEKKAMMYPDAARGPRE